MTKPITLALDWTPNSNHTGFYIAKAKGWYTEAGLAVDILSPHVDAYKSTPLSKVAAGSATFGICPSESVISYHTWPDGSKPKVVGIAACLQDSTSAVVTLRSSGIDRPSKLDGKVYASYGARYEGRIVQQMIKNDGGSGEFTESTTPMLGIWNTILKGQADATWVFMGWEGIEAEMQGVELNTFKLEDHGIAYGYSPLLVAHPDTLASNPAHVKAFLSASARGFEWAAAHPEEAAQLLVDSVAQEHQGHPLPAPLDLGMVKRAQGYAAAHYLDSPGHWGRMNPKVWESFVSWLDHQGLLTTKVQSRGPQTEHTTSLDGLRQGDVGEKVTVKATDLYTNDYLP